MNNRIKLVVTDLDGTFLRTDNKLSEENYQAVQALRQAGIIFTFATGRLDKMTRVYSEKLQLNEPVISCNGALIRTGLSNEIKHLHYMQSDDVKKIVNKCEEIGLDYLVYDTDEVFYPQHSKRIQAYVDYNELAKEAGSIPCKTTVFSEDELEGISKHTCKIYLHHEEPSRIAEIRNFIASDTKVMAVSSMDNNLDCAPENESKGQAVKFLMNYYGVHSEEVCVFGDNDNDVSMFKVAGFSFAMQNATKLAKENASELTASCNDNGFAQAVHKHILANRG